VNPFNAIAELILGKIKEGFIAAWAKFLFELIFSAVVSFLFVCGTALCADADAGLAIGGGMVMAALSMVVLFRRESSKLTRGMLVVLPSAEAAKELETDLQVIQKSDQEKKP
jgi:hypothetical protein